MSESYFAFFQGGCENPRLFWSRVSPFAVKKTAPLETAAAAINSKFKNVLIALKSKVKFMKLAKIQEKKRLLSSLYIFLKNIFCLFPRKNILSRAREKCSKRTKTFPGKVERLWFEVPRSAGKPLIIRKHQNTVCVPVCWGGHPVFSHPFFGNMRKNKSFSMSSVKQKLSTHLFL